ncbi:MAG: hypothetical protein WCG52_10925 [bacterium]
MALPQHKTCLSILRSILGPVAGGEARFAKTIGRSKSWIKKASAGIIQLSEDAAIRISHETGVSYNWLLVNDPNIPPVCLTEDIPIWQLDPKQFHNHPAANAATLAAYPSQEGKALSQSFTREAYDNRRASLQSGLNQKGTRVLIPMDVSHLFRIIQSACDQSRLSLFRHRFREFIEIMEQQFGVLHSDDQKMDESVIALAEEVNAYLQICASLKDRSKIEEQEADSKANGIKPKRQKKQPSRKKP